MKKKDYRPEIHALFEKGRKKIIVKHELDIKRLQWLDEKEEELFKENSREAYLQALDFFDLRKRVYLLPFSGKKYIVYP